MKIAVLFFVLLYTIITVSAQDATEIVKKADSKMQGESSQSEMEMKVVRPKWDRTICFKSWMKGRENGITLITQPAKESGQSFLKMKNEMWNWNPSISRMIKLPPSMMSQGWMGSDYTNDDMLKESSIVVDYKHKLLGTENVAGLDCYKIELMPKETAAVVWGKIIMWISKGEYYQLKLEYYDEDGKLVKTHLATDVRQMDDRKIPTKFEIIPADKSGQKTIVTIKTMKFNVKIADNFFTQQNMKNLK
jgi:outer membrane lipoprotein-sorting protein